MEFKTIIFVRSEFSINNKILPDFGRLLRQLRKQRIQIIKLKAESLNGISLPDFLYRRGLLAAQCLVLAARDETLQFFQAEDLAVLGYQNKNFPDEELFLADYLVEDFAELELIFLERVYQRKHKLPWTIAETRRCRLREITLKDLDALYEIYQEPQASRFVEALYEDRSAEEEYTKSYIENMYGYYGYGMWLIEELATGRLLGRAGLDLNEKDGENILELGYLIRREERKKGFALEVCQCILTLAAELTGFEEVSCFIEKGNLPSVCLAQKLGFRFVNEAVIQGKTMQRYRKTLLF